jgi:uncharacterized protein (DUF427 family)
MKEFRRFLRKGGFYEMKRKKSNTSPEKEYVWDYPRPPKLENSEKHIKVVFNGLTIAETKRSKRILETSHPPVYYIPPEDVDMRYLMKSTLTTVCEWKGKASYYTVELRGRRAENSAWYYPDPNKRYAELKNYIAFYAQLMDACYVDGEMVISQPGSFYGGWVTSDIVGPFKGSPGTMGW